MPAVINFGYFELQNLDNSEINFAEVVAVAPLGHFKRNDGYGFNIGDFKYVPSMGMVIDPDIVDNPRWNPAFRPIRSAGF